MMFAKGSKKKRNIDDDDLSVIEYEVPSNRKPRKFKSDSKTSNIRAPRKIRYQVPKKLYRTNNLLITLPRELRDEIYELALVKKDAIEISVKTVRHRRNRDIGEPAIWREPSLLMVSKNIRTEASKVYYGQNQFQIFLHTGYLETVSAWIQEKHDVCVFGNEGEESFDFHLHFTSFLWRSMRSWLALTTVFYEIDVLGDELDKKQADAKSRISYDPRGRKSDFLPDLGDAAALGVMAKQAEWSYERLLSEFDQWALSTLLKKY